MSVATGLTIDAAGDADTNLETENFNINTLKTDDLKDPPKAHLGGQIFGGIDVTPYDSEPSPAVKTFFGQNPIPDISELGLRLDNATTPAEQIKTSIAGAESATHSSEGASGFSKAELFSEVQGETIEKVEEDEDDDATDDTSHDFQCPCYCQYQQCLESHTAWKCNDVHDCELAPSRNSSPLIRSSNSSDETAFLDYGPREEPLITTCSEELESPKLTTGRSRDDCAAFGTEKIYDSYTPGSKAFDDEVNCQGTQHQYQGNQGTYVAKEDDDLSLEQFRRQLDNYMEADTTDHIRYCPSSSSNESNFHSSASSTANAYDGFEPLDEHKTSDQESDNKGEDDDDETVDVGDAALQRGPKFVCMPRSRRKQASRKSCRYWSNAGLMIREPRGLLCLYDDSSSPLPEENTLHHDSSRPPKEYIHPLLRSYNDLRGRTPVRGGDKADQGHGDRGDANQYQKSSTDSCKKKSARTRPSVYNRIRKFFRTFLRKKSSESTQTEAGPLPFI